uniref:Putative cysteine desulfurase n=1 Tax=Magnetococcus massalia (strain MO-1) TaxID=451514 RepID=A0A1S7LG08_MAGMO|nr:Putative cysteine desulfurase [Candidatus Magnetococcus massalia]
MLSRSPFRDEFQFADNLIYLNHAGVAPIPNRTRRVIAELAEHTAHYGASRYPELYARHQQVRQTCANLLNTTVDSVAFTPNTSEALSWIAMGMDWQPGDEIITTGAEFPSNAIVWLTLAERFGVVVHRLPAEADGRINSDKLLEKLNSRTRLLTVSSAQFSSGAMADLKSLGLALKDHPALFVVDAIQTLGALSLEPETLHIDALAADGHKWLLGPEGLGLFWLSEKGMATVEPRILGWHSVANAGDYDHITTELKPNMQRFEAGTPNLLGILALGESISMLLEAGMAHVEERVLALSAAFAEGLQELGCELHSPLNLTGHPESGIVVFTHPNRETKQLSKLLLEKGIYHAPRGGGIRFAAHFYQDQTDVDQALQVLKASL